MAEVPQMQEQFAAGAGLALDAELALLFLGALQRFALLRRQQRLLLSFLLSIALFGHGGSLLGRFRGAADM